MLLRTEYTVSRPRHAMSATKMAMPFEIVLAEGVQAVLTDHDDHSWHLSITERIDPSLLVLVPDIGWYREVDGERIPIPHLDVTVDTDARRLFVMQLLDALAFLFGYRLSLSVRTHDDRLLPESAEDRDLLDTYETGLLHG